jgi:predicted Zn-dependent protease
MTSIAGRLVRLLCATALFALALPATALALSQQQQWEMQIGQRQYMQLLQQGKIVPQSPLYQQLEPVAKRIAAVADPQYFTPFHFILVNEPSPNAFSVPGGNVYVTTSLLQFVKNQDELAGVLCHEVSHDIHHDVYNENRKDSSVATAAGVLGMLLGMQGGYGGYLGQMAVGVGADAQTKTYSRQAESNADRAGAYTCAKAGYNPWGMVWLFERFHGVGGSRQPEWLSDHPRDNHRITDLETLFRSDPATFGKFLDDPAAATPLPAIKTPAPQLFSPHAQQPGYPQQPPGYPYPQQPPGYPYPQQPPGYPYPQQPPGRSG